MPKPVLPSHDSASYELLSLTALCGEFPCDSAARFEKVVRNIIRAKFLRPGIRAYRTENIYAPFAGPGAGKEDVIEKHKEKKRSRRQG